MERGVIMEKKKVTARVMRILLTIMTLSLIIAAAVIPVSVFADEDGGFKDSVYVLGTKVTQENKDDVLGNGGSVKYDFDKKELTLTNALIDLSKYKSDADENNYVAGITHNGEMTIRLVGYNLIISDASSFSADKQYVFGINSNDDLTITGTGELSIQISTHADGLEYDGIDSTKKLTVSGCEVRVFMNDKNKSTGIDLGFDSMTVQNGAEVLVTTTAEGSTSVYDVSLGRLAVSSDSVLEMISTSGKAIQYTIISDDLKALGATVNTDPYYPGSFEWDKTTRLDTYKLVRFPQKAAESNERWGDSVYILGTEITEQNASDVLQDGGSVKFDFAKRELTLTNATLDLADYNMPGVENNYVAGISNWGDVNIVLVGANKIISNQSQFAEDKKYVYGIHANAKAGISGTGTLDIEIRTGAEGVEFTGIDSNRKLTVSGGKLSVEMKGTGKSTAISAMWEGFAIEKGASVFAGAEGDESCGIHDTSFGDSTVDEGAVLEIKSDGKAFFYYILADSVTALGANVNTAPSYEGSAEWDKSTRLDFYKYVRIPYKAKEEEEKKDEPVTVRKNSTLKVTVKAKTVKVSYRKLKKKAKVIKRRKILTVSKSHGKVSYKIVSVKRGKSTKYRKYFRISNGGNITVKKGLKKGKYKVTVKVSDKGDTSYKPGSKKKTITIKVK